MTDYDTDNDGLIEISNVAQLNAIRHDVDGNGMVATTNQNAYDLAFPDPFPGLGCKPVSDTPTCTGYEIGALPSSFALNIDLNVAPHNAGKGWAPSTTSPPPSMATATPSPACSSTALPTGTACSAA